MDIKVLGPGCPKCHQTEKHVKEAVAETGVDASVEKITDLMEIAGYGVFGTPLSLLTARSRVSAKSPQKRMSRHGLINSCFIYHNKKFVTENPASCYE